MPKLGLDLHMISLNLQKFAEFHEIASKTFARPKVIEKYLMKLYW